ncbi:hypothetical protein LOK49_LG03G00227 [Camellia lanceoleosa]|uniref:Uncharacterized protein n=1 Tax=Camellia lanceoleosa TaxID=1840588 RepID=A0ACC0I670_9ERIC|nr:hypothetical protein LOK49_LG03G00227 [Camellia lanceoleosa]
MSNTGTNSVNTRLEQHFEEFNIKKLEVNLHIEPLKKEIATTLQFKYQLYDMAPPEGHSWKSIREELAKFVNPGDPEDVCTLTLLLAELNTNPYSDLYTKALKILVFGGSSSILP